MSPIRYDFRSDSVTRPGAAMRAAMAVHEALRIVGTVFENHAAREAALPASQLEPVS